MRKEILKVYREAKIRKDFILFFRQNNYYVAIFDDAKKISSELNIPLLSKNKEGMIYYVVIQENRLISTLVELDKLSLHKYSIIETIEFEL